MKWLKEWLAWWYIQAVYAASIRALRGEPDEGVWWEPGVFKIVRIVWKLPGKGE